MVNLACFMINFQDTDENLSPQASYLMSGCGDGHCSFPRSDTSVVERRQAAFSKSQSAISKCFSWFIQGKCLSPDSVGSLWQHLTFFRSKLIPRGTGNEQVACCTQIGLKCDNLQKLFKQP